MTTQTEHLVLNIVLNWRTDTRHTDELVAAADLLAAERSHHYTELELTFGQLVAGDSIQSINGRWYEVDRMVVERDQTGVKVWLKGVAKPLEKYTGQSVLVRRSEMGKAADVLASVLWSGPATGTARVRVDGAA